MTRLSVPRSRLAGTLTTPGATGCTAGVDASCSSMQQQPDATCTGLDVTKRKKKTDE